MGQALYEQEPAARAVFDQADELLGFSLSRLCFEGPQETLTDTVNQQPALYVTSMAAWAVWQRHEQTPPLFMAGHSLGELTALAAAGAYSFEAGLALVRRRGELMKRAGEQTPGAMAAVLGLEGPQVDEICAQAREQSGAPLQVANDNCPGQTVISGDARALEAALALAEAAGARKLVRLPITIAAHSPLMAPAAEAFAGAVAHTAIMPAQAPIIANTTATPISAPDDIRRELAAQLTGSVQWAASMRYARDRGGERFVELGPGDVLTSLMKRIDRKAQRSAFLAAYDTQA